MANSLDGDVWSLDNDWRWNEGNQMRELDDIMKQLSPKRKKLIKKLIEKERKTLKRILKGK